MNEKKNIDTFFKDKLEHFEVSPPEIAWKNIETKLNEKEEKKRVIPFWWKFAGVAAILFLGFGLFHVFFNDSIQTDNTIVNQDTTTTQPTENVIVVNDSNTGTPKERVGSNLENLNDNTINETVSTNSADEKISKTTISDKNNKAVISVSTNKKNIDVSNRKASNSKVPIANSNGSLASNSAASKSNKKSQKTTNEKSNTSKETTSNSSIANNISQSKSEELNTNKTLPTNGSIDKNNSINDSKSDIAVINTTEEIKKIDSTKVAAVEPNALEELLNEKEKKITKEQKINRWQVTPNVAPIYFSSLSNGSPLDEKLEDNKKVYGTNYSYGLAINYALNKKYSIRTGVHSYSVDYDTKDIVFYQDTNASKMQNLNPNSQGSFIQIDPLNYVNTSFGRILGEKFEGSLNQQTSYIEVPFEVTYKVLSKKFGVDVIGGISTLFLNQNDVYLKGTGFTMKIGEASNLNNIHFSTNIGLGLKYAFLKRFDARIEPLFKYQINTFSSGAGNFKPYVFGVYSGISYHFN